MYQSKFILHVLIFVRTQCWASVLLQDAHFGWRYANRSTKATHQDWKTDFSLVHTVNCYLNLNKQQSLVFEDQF
jgi:hypothetical protein